MAHGIEATMSTGFRIVAQSMFRCSAISLEYKNTKIYGSKIICNEATQSDKIPGPSCPAYVNIYSYIHLDCLGDITIPPAPLTATASLFEIQRRTHATVP